MAMLNSSFSLAAILIAGTLVSRPQMGLIGYGNIESRTWRNWAYDD